ncbi:MAG: hypothetical protein AAF986_09945 [Pseudomonadota bacterium]
MLLVAAGLTVAVALMHSLLGGRRLIAPLLSWEGFPSILGAKERARVTLRFGWHLLSVNWVAMAGVLVLMHQVPALKSDAFLWMMSGVFGLSGLIAIIFSQGRHLSWVMFLPVAVLCALATG